MKLIEWLGQQDQDLYRAVQNVRADAARIWARPLHRYYTDHTIAHSERVIDKLDGLAEVIMTTKEALSTLEVFILLAAAYLHDIGMQNERFVGKDLEEIRRVHHEVSSEMIFGAFEQPDRFFAIDLIRNPDVVNAVALVSEAHRKIELLQDKYDEFVCGVQRVRPRLLGALLRLGDELDIDHERVDMEQIKIAKTKKRSRFHWYKCYYVSGVQIKDEVITIFYRFPPGQAYDKLIPRLVKAEIEHKLENLRPILHRYRVRPYMQKPQIRKVRGLMAMPDDVLRFARRELARLSHQESVETPKPAVELPTNEFELDTTERGRCGQANDFVFLQKGKIRKIRDEYVGDRHILYESALEKHSVVGIWGDSGHGKTWVGAQIALRWQQENASRPAMWFECQNGMGFQELICAIADYLRTQGVDSLWNWIQKQPREQPFPVPPAIRRLVQLLDQEQYLLCFDDFYRVDYEQQEIHQLFEELVGRLEKTKMILLSRQAIPFRVGGHLLPDLKRTEVRELITKLGQHYQKEWLRTGIAAEFSHKLVSLVDFNMKWMEELAIDWLRNHTTESQARAYMENLSDKDVVEKVLKLDDDMAAVLFVLSACEDPVDIATLNSMANSEGVGQDRFEIALNELIEIRLIEVKLINDDGEQRCGMHDTVRERVLARLAEKPGRRSRIHRYAASLFLQKGRQAGANGTNYWHAFRHYVRAEAYAEAMQVLSDHVLDLVFIGRTKQTLGQLEEMVNIVKGKEQEGLLGQRHWLWVYILRSFLNSRLGRPEEAKSAAQEGLKELEWGGNRDFKREEAHLYARRGISLLEMGLGSIEQFETFVGDLTRSEAAFRDHIKAGEIFEERCFRRYEFMRVLDGLGRAYTQLAGRQQGDARTEAAERAVGYFKELQETAQGEGKDPRFAFFIARAPYRLAQVYNDMEKYEQALNNAKDSLQRFEKLKSPRDIHLVSEEMARIYLQRGEYTRAAESYNRSLDMARELDDKKGMVTSHAVLGEIDIICGELASARKHLEMARRILEGGPETEQEGVEIGEPVRFPDYELFVSVCERWLEGLELLARGESEAGAEKLDKALLEFRDQGYDSDAALVERDLVHKFGRTAPEPETIACGEEKPSEPTKKPASAPTGAMYKAYNTATVRKLLIDAFDDEGLIILCHNHFDDVYEKFSTGMTKSRMIQLLLDHCERQLLMDELLDQVKKANPKQYARYRSRLRR